MPGNATWSALKPTLTNPKGHIGNAIAYNLRKYGVDVIVLDREETGNQASSAAAGLLAPFRCSVLAGYMHDNRRDIIGSAGGVGAGDQLPHALLGIKGFNDV
jgi:glycine/D-amino acid oxidase-like deaminating enzyme